MWVFGYGSLLWKIDFPCEKRVLGYIKGFKRRFYQYSTDHRGIPGNPGRVVTLVHGDEQDKVYGIAFKISETNVKQVTEQLDFREKGGYERLPLVFYPLEETIEPIRITIYHANAENPNYAGPDTIENIANQVVKSIGPSGSNVEYVINLAKAQRDYFPEIFDEHLFELEKNVLELLKKKEQETKEKNTTTPAATATTTTATTTAATTTTASTTTTTTTITTTTTTSSKAKSADV